MTLEDRLAEPEAAGPARSVLNPAGVGFLVAGVLQLLAMVRAILPSAPEWVTPGYQLLGWLVGGLVLVGASILLAVGRRGAGGVVGRSRWSRAALVTSGSGHVLLTAVSVLAFALGSPAYAWTTVLLALVQALILTATGATAAAVLRTRVLTGAARWGFVGLAVVDGVALVLLLVPPAILVALDTVLIARPLVVAAVGAALVLSSGRRD